MPVLISMLRGVNVGGHNRIKMEALRALYESLGLRSPRSLVQSGNIVFSSGETNLVRLAGRIETAIERSFGFRPSVIIRTCSEMKNVIDRSPYATRHPDPSRRLVLFLASDPDEEGKSKLRKIETADEEFFIVGREVYIYYPNGMGRPKVSPMAIEKALKTPATGRNWNTVTKLLELAQNVVCA